MTNLKETIIKAEQSRIIKILSEVVKRSLETYVWDGTYSDKLIEVMENRKKLNSQVQEAIKRIANKLYEGK